MLAAPGPPCSAIRTLRTPAGQQVREAVLPATVLFHPGHTNRQVTQALFLSPRTIEANLTRVYRKLGVYSRAELGAVMARSGATPPAS